MVRVIRQKSLFERFKDNIHNFKLFGFLGVSTLLIVGTFYLVRQQIEFRQHASDLTSIEYGFNTHLNPTGTGNESNLSLSFFHTTVDALVANQQKWVRLNIVPGHVVGLTSGSNNMSWNETNLQQYDDAISYAKVKGLKVYLLSSTPDFANYFSDTEYTKITTDYFTYLAQRYKGKVDVWQIYNEADTLNYKGYPSPPLPDVSQPYPVNYLSGLKTNIEAAKSAIKSVDPTPLITTNVTGFVLNQTLYDKWNTFFSVIGPSLDILSFDLYPQNTSEINTIKNAIAGVASSYAKPIIIAETGIPTGDGRFDEAAQSSILIQILDQVRPLLPKAILYYQYSDTIQDNNKTEGSFGVVKIDGSQKLSYSTIMQNMNIPPGLLRVETNPTVGVTIQVTSVETNQVVLVKDWGISWEKLKPGNYILTFSNPTNVTIYDKKVIIPQPLTIPISSGSTTTIVADLTTGTLQFTKPDGTTTTITPIITPTYTPTPTSVPPTPTQTPTPTPITKSPLTVATSPSVNATINIVDTATGKIVLTSTRSINTTLPLGNYYVVFGRYSTYRTPTTTGFYIKSGKTTQIIGNYYFGRTSVVYK